LRVPPIRLCRAFAESIECRFHLEQPWIANVFKEVHQSDLTEGRINQDFVDWLQTKGMSWLLVVLVGFVRVLAMIRWQHHRRVKLPDRGLERAAKRAAAQQPSKPWLTNIPMSERWAQLARLQAAGEYLQAVASGQDLER